MAGLVGEEALKFVQNIWKMCATGKRYDKHFKNVIITAAGQGSCTAEFKVEEGMTNSGGTLHGGATASLIDMISSLGLMTKNQVPGVSVNLSVNYLKGAAEGETIIIESKTVKCGKSLAFLETTLKKKDSNDIVATSSHIKFVGG